MNGELKRIIEQERILYIPHVKSLKNWFMVGFTHAEEYRILRFMCALRSADYYKTRNKVLYSYRIRNANIRGETLEFSIPDGVHTGSIIINLKSVIGDRCCFQGENCISNNGKDNNCLVLGNRIELGVGAKNNR